MVTFSRNAAYSRKLTGKITVVQHPDDIFYKDEGGKSKCMTATLKLIKLKDNGKVCRMLERDLRSIPLKVSLYYESGLKVEQHDQGILRLMHQDDDDECPAVCPKKRTGAVHYRIEKVSRRKDGQRFKLLIEVDHAACPPGIDTAGVMPCFTDPVCIRSKRKAPISSSDSARSAKRRRVAVTAKDLEAQVGGKLESIEGKVDRLVQLVDMQQQQIASLERALVASFSVRKNDTPATTKEKGVAQGNPEAAASSSPQVLQISPLVKSRPMMKRLVSADMRFDFGMPSSPVPLGYLDTENAFLPR